MRSCEGCGKPNTPYYDHKQACTCEHPNAIGLNSHKAGCKRFRHSITPYLTELRPVRLQREGVKRHDRFDEAGNLEAPPNGPHEYQRLLDNGFKVRRIGKHVWSEKLICAECVYVWVQREECRKAHEQAKRGKAEETYYTMLCSQ